MDIKGIDAYASAQSGTTVKKNDELDKNAFLKILAAQLSNQDPLNPQDNTQFIAQMAQFTSLEQSQNLNASVSKMLLSQNISEGSLLIGKDVTFMVDTDKIEKQAVTGMVIDGTSIYLKTKNGYYNLNSVVGVGEISDKQATEQSTTNGDTTKTSEQSTTTGNTTQSTEQSAATGDTTETKAQ